MKGVVLKLKKQILIQRTTFVRTGTNMLMRKTKLEGWEIMTKVQRLIFGGKKINMAVYKTIKRLKGQNLYVQSIFKKKYEFIASKIWFKAGIKRYAKYNN